MNWVHKVKQLFPLEVWTPWRDWRFLWRRTPEGFCCCCCCCCFRGWVFVGASWNTRFWWVTFCVTSQRNCSTSVVGQRCSVTEWAWRRQGKFPWGEGGYSPKFWVGVCRTILKTLTLFQTKIYYISYPLKSEINEHVPCQNHTLFQTKTARKPYPKVRHIPL